MIAGLPLGKTSFPQRTPLAAALEEIIDRCTECSACTRNCAFLAKNGTPKSIAIGFDFTSPLHQQIAYQCSLCGLCAAVCPEQLEPDQLFLEIRRQHVKDGHFSAKLYRPLIAYESLGSSRLFSWAALPQKCETVFFPGCTLPGTRPTVTLQMYQQLRQAIPSLGMVLHCCSKPSHDLGRTAFFHSRFDELLNRLASHGIRSVLTACPNCTKIFRQYGQGLAVQTVYEIFHAHGLGKTLASNTSSGEVCVHDPCPFRDDLPVQSAIRGLLTDLGHTVVDMRHQKQRTLCCGEGGAVGFVKPQFAQGWATLRCQEAGKRKLVTYCAGCTNFLNRVTPTVHIVDLLFRPEAAAKDTLNIARGPSTYLNRIILKHRIKKMT
ncbi:MAG: (Fe-S)-binding protein [Desulfobulbaceae bacterium]|nr:(Fe-S)-binding protein [Desulfobulbaceae bacterium]